MPRVGKTASNSSTMNIAASLAFEAKLSEAADAVRNNMDGPDYNQIG